MLIPLGCDFSWDVSENTPNLTVRKRIVQNTRDWIQCFKRLMTNNKEN